MMEIGVNRDAEIKALYDSPEKPSLKEIALRLDMAEWTVKTRVTRMLKWGELEYRRPENGKYVTRKKVVRG
jgi:hypothetical protein